MKKALAIMAAAAVLSIATVSQTAWAAAGCGASSTEWWPQLGYDGEVWLKPCTNYTLNGRPVHALSARARHVIPGYADSGWYTVNDAGPSSCGTKKKTWKFNDTLNPFAPKTQFKKEPSTAPKGVW